MSSASNCRNVFLACVPLQGFRLRYLSIRETGNVATLLEKLALGSGTLAYWLAADYPFKLGASAGNDFGFRG